MSFIPKMALALALPKLINQTPLTTYCQNKKSYVPEKTAKASMIALSPLPPSQIKKALSTVAQTNKDDQSDWFKWLSKVAALSLETPSAIALINYRFFKQNEIGSTTTYTPKFTDYFKGLSIVGPLRVATYSFALGASDLGQSVTSYFWPDSRKETQYLVGGGCSALVGGFLSVPVEGVMVKGMDAMRNQHAFNIIEALLSKPSSSALFATWGREMPYFLGLAVGAKLIQPLLPNAIPETQKENIALIVTATGVSYATQPADTIKSKVQQNQWTIRKSVMEMSKNGPQAFFVGALPRLAKVYLNFFVTWVVAAKIYNFASGNQDKTQ